MKTSLRTEGIPKYIFSELDEIKKELIKKREVIDLGIGDPDIPTPKLIVEAMSRFINNSENYRYPPYSGIDEFKIAVAKHYKRNFNVDLDYETEVVSLIGSKEGIAHLFFALTDPLDYVILPDPAYPVYKAAALISGCNIFNMPLYEKNNYLPDINIDRNILEKTKLLIVNYPNNPTGAVADENFFKELISFGINNDIVIVNDGAYLDIYGCDRPLSILQIPYAKDIAVEFGSLSKSYNMTGWRLGYVVGCKDVLKKLMIIKTNFDSGQFGAIQQAGVMALNEGDYFINYINNIYSERRKMVVDILKQNGFNVYDSKGTFYVWFKVPKGYTSIEFCKKVLKDEAVIITPGNAFGSLGEGYCRISLTVESSKLKEAVIRISNIKP